MTSVQNIVERYKNREEKLITMLQDVQKTDGYLSESALREIADRVGVSLSRVFSLATFYKSFSLSPRGRHIVQVCMGTACHVRGGQRILDSLKEELDVETGETTGDGAVTLQEVRCVGCCGLAPVIVRDETFYGKMNQKKSIQMVRALIPERSAR